MKNRRSFTRFLFCLFFLFVLMLIVALVGVLSGCTNIKDKGDAPSSDVLSSETPNSDEVMRIQKCHIHFSDETLVKEAECIVTGRIKEVKIQDVIIYEDRTAYPYSFYTVQIDKKLKGVPDDVDEVTVRQLGDDKTVVDLTWDGSGGYMKKGDNVLLFLCMPDAETLAFFEKIYNKPVEGYLVYSSQGRIWLDENGDFDKEKEEYNTTALSKIRSVEDVEEMLKALE